MTALNCSGTATGVEFCYRRTAQNSINIFTLYAMADSADGFLITKVIKVFSPASLPCVGDCCTVYNFPPDKQFELPSSNFSFGVLGSQLLGFGSQPRAPQYKVNSLGLSLSVNDIVTKSSNCSNETLRILRFIVGKSFKVLTNNRTMALRKYLLSMFFPRDRNSF